MKGRFEAGIAGGQAIGRAAKNLLSDIRGRMKYQLGGQQGLLAAFNVVGLHQQ